MKLLDIIQKRRAYRSLERVEITMDLIEDLASCARLSPSCFNNQPWRYLFVYDPEILTQMHQVFTPGNKWAEKASLLIVVFCKKEDDCVIRDREYYLFDTGMATAFIILRATELGLVVHPIAGYSPKMTREILRIPEEMKVITLVIVGKHSKVMSHTLSEKQRIAETQRPERKKIDEFVYLNKY